MRCGTLSKLECYGLGGVRPTTIMELTMNNQERKNQRVRDFISCGDGLRTLFAIVFVLALTYPALLAQSDPSAQSPDSAQPAPSAKFPVGLPPRAPGYDHFYQSEQASTVFATRWGYFDGYQDGKRDRELGKTVAPTDQDRYKLVPDHGYHPEIPRATYKTIYKAAYLRGYGYGSQF